MRLAQDISAPTEARRFARRWSLEKRIPDRVVADLELVVAELVTNALVHANPPYEIDLRLDGPLIHGEVSDGSYTKPHVDRDSGRGGFGLPIVDLRTCRWGSALRPDGKRVWFEIESQS
jgi:anti-sigma regulatory factor (Ser/Thr protein kinase)